MNTCKNQKSYLYSFGEIDYEADDFEECNLSDELLSEDVIINKPTSILSLSENMENSPHSRRIRAADSFKNEKCQSEFKEIRTYGRLKTLRNKLHSFSQNLQSEFKSKLTLKEDIKYLLKCLVDKKKSIVEEQQQNIFVSVKDIGIKEIE